LVTISKLYVAVAVLSLTMRRRTNGWPCARWRLRGPTSPLGHHRGRYPLNSGANEGQSAQPWWQSSGASQRSTVSAPGPRCGYETEM